MKRPAAVLHLAVASACLLAVTGPAHALFKVIGPDGKVTYTDRPPSATDGRVVPVGRADDTQTADGAGLPASLRAVVLRFPVTLYTVDACEPCDRARDMLVARGVPYRERKANNATDRDDWLRAVGGLEAPALAIGAQMLRGYAADTWASYLDTAGYPRESQLPRNYSPPAVRPLVERAPVPAADDEPATPAPAPSVPPPLPSPSGIRF